MKQQTSALSLRLFSSQLTSIISIALVLFLMGGVVLISCIAQNLSTYVKENIGFTIILDQEIKANQVNSILKNLDKTTGIKSVTYITKEEALKILIDELGEDPNEFLGYNPLSASIEVHLSAEYATPASLKKLQQKIMQYAGVEEIVYRKDLVNLVNDNVNKVGAVLLALVVVLLAISYTLINNTIRLTIYSKRFLIHTMKLVGASQGFIRRPFVWRSIGNGIIAALLAIAMMIALLFYMTGQLNQLFTMVHITTLWGVFATMVGAGILITATSAYHAVTKFLNMSQDKLYYI